MRYWTLGLIGLALAGTGASHPRPAQPGPDTLTMSYSVAGLHVIQRVNRATDIVAARLYLLGGTRQLTEATAGIEALLLDASGYGTERYPGEQARRAMARTGSVVQTETEADWSVLGFRYGRRRPAVPEVGRLDAPEGAEASNFATRRAGCCRPS